MSRNTDKVYEEMTCYALAALSCALELQNGIVAFMPKHAGQTTAAAAVVIVTLPELAEDLAAWVAKNHQDRQLQILNAGVLVDEKKGN